MDSNSPIDDPQYEATPHSSARHPRVDPRYPLHYQSGYDSYANGQSMPAGEGPQRTTSRRRKPSGSRGADPNLGMPVAPDAPRSSRGPPLSYRDPYAGEPAQAPPPPQDNPSRSFSARASTQPNAFDNSFAAYNASAPLPPPENRKHSRHTSTGQTLQAVPVAYPQVQKPAEPMYTAAPGQTAKTRTADAPRSSPRSSQPHDNAQARTFMNRSANALPVRSNTVRSSTGEPSDWASDRSPLQRLEVKLNDISKEEKRARVMEAERRLRESQSGGSGRRASQGIGPDVDRAPSKRGSTAADVQRRGSQIQREARDIQGQPVDSNYGSIGRNNSTREPSSGRRASLEPQAGKLQKAPPPEIANRRVSDSQQRSVDAGRGDNRAVRFHGQAASAHATEPIQQPNRAGSVRKSGDPQMHLHNDRMMGGKHNENEEPDPIPGEAVRSHKNHGPKYQIPPQTAAGIEARQRIGFGSRVDDPAEIAQSRNHHFSNLFHGRRDQTSINATPAGAPRHLNEWKKGGVAFLTLADANAPAVEPPKTNKDQAWWESPKSGNQRRRSSGVGEITAFDGSQEDSNGMTQSFFREADSSTSSSSSKLRAYLHKRARGDETVDYNGDTGPYIHQANRTWLGFKNGGTPRSVTGSLDSGSSIYSSVASQHSDSRSRAFKKHFNLFRRHSHDAEEKKKLNELIAPESFDPPLYLKCGPLLRYTGLKREKPEQSRRGNVAGRETWRGSVMIVTDDNLSTYKPVPSLRLFHEPMELLPPPPQQYDGPNAEPLQAEYVDPVAGIPKITRTGGTVYVKPVEDLEIGKDVSRIENDEGLYEATRTANVPTSYGKAYELLGRGNSTAPDKGKSRNAAKVGRFKEVKGVRLHTERGFTFWRFNLEIELGGDQQRIAYRINHGAATGFYTPAKGLTMNIMFHSCNGFSKSVDSNTFSGPDPLWRDVLNAHQLKPFHVMVGGGDQIYNDKVMDEAQLFKEWLEIKNPHHKHEAEFSPEMQDQLEYFYLERYSMWFSQGLFGMANSQIPMINIWDDHDIIDGFGSYPHHFMSSKVFSGLGNVAFKYYLLFQHQSVVDETEADEPSWLLGSGPGPYINELNRSVFMSLGGNVAILGLDCRTERTRDEVLSESSYDLVLDRCEREIVRGETQHLIVLLGVPIAYPRLVWLENILTSRALDPVKALGRMGMLGNFMNKFDGGVEILDDLDDHWTARNHKDERNWFIEELQTLAAEKSVRITILGGDVHLAAVGQFYSNKNLKIPKDKDHRYMPNIISSAIVNTPPPDMMADVLNKRNKIHHLNQDTDEDMIPMFTHDVDGKARNNKRLLPKRNWCSITEYMPGSTPPSTPSTMSPTASQESLPQKPPGGLKRTLSLGSGNSKPAQLIRRLSLGQKPQSYVDRSPSPPETPPETRMVSAPIPIRPVSQFQRRPTNMTIKAAAKGGGDNDGHINLEFGLDIKINCEIKQGDPSGSTESYRLLVPALWSEEGEAPPHKPRKLTLLQRLNSKRRAAPKQGAGNWGQSDTETGSDSESDDPPKDFYGQNLARPNVVHQKQPPQSQPKQSSEVPKRSISLLQKRPAPFKPRPQPEQEAQPRSNFPPISAPIPQTHQAQSGGVRGQNARQNPTRPISSGSDSYGEDDEELFQPKRRVGSKFDNSGVSKFFGGGPSGGQGGQGPPQGQNGGGGMMRSNSMPDPQRSSSGGYSGIEAYSGEKKGWRKFF